MVGWRVWADGLGLIAGLITGVFFRAGLRDAERGCKNNPAILDEMTDVLGIVVAEFNKRLTDAMLQAAQEEAKALGAVVSSVICVPGTYEIPLFAARLLGNPEISAVVVLGFIERGETQHGEVMGHVVQSSLLQSSLKFQKPVGFGLIGPGATEEQANIRKDAYARAAVRAALSSSRTLAKMSGK